MKVVITSGGTREYIDDVRVMTNVSSGRLGAQIANEFLKHGKHVTYVSPSNAVMPALYFTGKYDFVGVKDTESVYEAMEALVPKADVVIQTMAVSDFTFDRDAPVKLSSSDADAFIEYMRQTIKKTPKVIAKFREWNESAVLVGFKFTVGEKPKALKEIATQLMLSNGLDMVFANDKMHMEKSGDHVGTLIMRDWEEPVRGKDAIAEGIYMNVVRVCGVK